MSRGELAPGYSFLLSPNDMLDIRQDDLSTEFLECVIVFGMKEYWNLFDHEFLGASQSFDFSIVRCLQDRIIGRRGENTVRQFRERVCIEVDGVIYKRFDQFLTRPVHPHDGCQGDPKVMVCDLEDFSQKLER
jgi:hypothetical protein